MYSRLKLVPRPTGRLQYLLKSGKRESVRFVSDVSVIDLPQSSCLPISSYLEEKKVPFSEGYTCLKVNECTVCSQVLKKTSTTTNITNLYINKKTGYFACDKCKIMGSWNILQKLLNEVNEATTLKQLNQMKEGSVRYDKLYLSFSGVISSSTLLSTFSDDECDAILSDFNLLQISKQIIEKLQIRVNSDKTELYFPLYNNSSSHIVGFKILDKSGNSSTLPKTDCPGVLSYPSKLNKKKSEALIVANIFDFVALLQQNLSVQIICLPYGVTNLPQSVLPFLESYNKLILWLGVDAGAWHSTSNFLKKLNEKRCHLIQPTNPQISPRAAVENNVNIEKLVSNARTCWNEYVTNFRAMREDILSEVQNNNEVVGVPWKRFPKLNEILKGHRRGELTVLTGPTGCGKTTFMSEYSLDLAMQGVNTLWGSFEIRNARLARMMLQQYAGQPLTENLNCFNQWADEFEQLPIYFMTFHGQQKITKVMDAVENIFYIYDIGHIVIDNVQFMIDLSLDASQIDRFWMQDCIIQAFRSFATRCNCHVTLVSHPRKVFDGAELNMNSIFGGGKLSQEADNVLILQDKKFGPNGVGKKFLQICKNRFAGDLGLMPLNFNKKSLSFSSVNKRTVNNNEIEFNRDEEYISKVNEYCSNSDKIKKYLY